MMAPAFEQAAAQLEPRVQLVKVNTDEAQGVGARLNIRSIPTIALFVNGREVARQAGAMGAAEIVRWAQAQALTGEISQALNSGKHTTTATTWYWVDQPSGTALIDSPGFQEFGLHHIAPMQLAQLMPDLKPHASECRFYNCTHLHEPGCDVQAAVLREGEPTQPGRIEPSRYRIYRTLFEELSQTRY